eukprot:m.322274 g.322274  ORF g.322274 m.322274 type:complete len:542 (+) comp26676_c0_seq1:124-1749(+)
MSARLLCLVLLAAATARAHICLISPQQRGPYFNASQAGDPGCFRHEVPCGGQYPPNPAPFPSFTAGGQMTVKLQQNLNHYEVGFPGYIDVGYSTKTNPTSDDDFVVLAVVADTNWHQQSHQQNYTLTFAAPNVECAHCVMRVRYNAHKPGETTFRQCSDFALVAASSTPVLVRAQQKMVQQPSTRRVLAQNDAGRAAFAAFDRTFPLTKQAAADTLLGVSFSEVDATTADLVSVDTSTAAVQKVATLPFGLASPAPSQAQAQARTAIGPSKYLLDQISAYDSEHKTLYYILHSEGSMEQIPTALVVVDLASYGYAQVQLFGLPAAVNGLVYVPGRGLIAFVISPKGNEGYIFNLYTIDVGTGVATLLYATSSPEPLFVNYQWTDFADDTVYILMGDENSLYALNVRLYSFNLQTTVWSMQLLNNTEYTISSVQNLPVYGLVAASPGLFKPGVASAWSIVSVMPTGEVSKICDLAPAGAFQPYYGQTIFNVTPDGVLYVRLLSATTATTVLARVHVTSSSSCDVTFSNHGNLGHVHNLAVRL